MILLSALLIMAPAAANDLAGLWDLKSGDDTLFRIEIVQTPESVSASWLRPENLTSVEGGESFWGVGGPIVRRTARQVRWTDKGLELSFAATGIGEEPTILQLRRLDDLRVELTLIGTGFEPFVLTRTPVGAAPLGGFNPKQRYVREFNRPTNAEMTAIYEADQADRRADTIDWSIVSPADEARLARTAELIAADELRSGEDFLHAAFIYQHGDKPEEILKAHLLGMAAVARGEPGGSWIAAASLDRYLHYIGQPQVLGTQFKTPPEGSVTQEPYDRTLLTDSLRRVLTVPSLAKQDEQRQLLEDHRPPPPAE